VGRDGAVYQLVPDELRAWHAGKSTWKGRTDCNDYSIGIGVSNRSDGELYTDAQYDALAELVANIHRRWSIPWAGVVGHYHVSPDRKTDPWYTFEWMRLIPEST
jgi:N-acetyl-anhydromuramyl-L-alanine amidase AmpD